MGWKGKVAGRGVVRRVALGLGLLLLGGVAKAQEAAPPAERARRILGQLPLTFEANRGQLDFRVRFYARGSGYELFLTQDSAALRPKASGGAGVRMRLLGARSATPAGQQRLVTESHYFRGQDPARWHTHVPHFGQVAYRGVYPGIDWVFHGRPARTLEYDFELKPGARVSAIRLAFNGSAPPRLDAAGDLVLALPGGGELRQSRPRVYQRINGQRREVDGRYALLGKGEVGFRVGAYDRRHRLVIEPSVAGDPASPGANGDDIRGVAIDGKGIAYLTGATDSTDWPGNGRGSGSGREVLLARLGPGGSALLSVTVLGGTRDRAALGHALALDSRGGIFLAGDTASPDFPTTSSAFQPGAPSPGGVRHDAFFTRLDPSGSRLLYSTYLGGGDFDTLTGMAIGPGDQAWVVGSSSSPDFVTTPGAFRATLEPRPGAGPARTAFVARIDPSGAGRSSLVFATWLGGPHSGANGVAVDSLGNAYVAGDTTGSGFPTRHALQGCESPAPQGFLACLSPDGTALTWSTCLRGSSGATHAAATAVDTGLNAYVVGDTTAPDFPTTANAAQAALAGRSDAFVTVFHFDASTQTLARTYSTFLGGQGDDRAVALALGPPTRVWVTGDSSSADFPRVKSSRDLAGKTDAFLTELKVDGSPWLFSSLLGGDGEAHATSLFATPLAEAWVGGSASPLEGFVFKHATYVNLGLFPRRVDAVPGGRIHVGYEAVNQGTAPAEEVVLSARLPVGIRVRSARMRGGECSIRPGAAGGTGIRCELRGLPPRARAQVALVLVLERAVPAGTRLTVTAGVESTSEELTPRDNLAVIEILAGRRPGVRAR